MRMTLSFRHPFPILLFCCVILACLSGCTQNTPVEASLPAPDIATVTTEVSGDVVFSSAVVSPEAEEVTLILTEEDIPLLDSLTRLKALHAEGSACTGAIVAYAKSHPGVAVSYTVRVCGADYSPDSAEMDIPANALDVASLSAALPYLPNLKKITVSDGTIAASDAADLLAACPAIDMEYSVDLLGSEIPCTTEGLDLCDIPAAHCREVADVLSVLPSIKYVCINPDGHSVSSEDTTQQEEPVISERVSSAILADETYTPINWKPEAGATIDHATEWTLENVAALQQAHPGLIVDYPISAFGISFSASAEVLTLSGISMKQHIEELYALVPYLTNCTLIEMENCNIGNVDMAVIRERVSSLQPYSPINVVWVIHCGPYSCRTDAIMIKFAGKKQVLTDSDAEVLQYCTKVRYLDLGHNHLRKMDFVSYMPDLEVAILGVGYFLDCAPLVNCPKLEYLELESGLLQDISALSGLTGLKHLNIAYNRLTDLSPLYSLTGLKRCWISRNAFPEEQIEKLKQLLPDCNINTTAHDPTSQGWRKLNGVYDERYLLLKEQFVYANGHIRSYYIKRGKLVPYYT